MDNFTIADNLSLLGRLMDIHGENAFKAKSYSTAAFNIEKLPVQLAEVPRDRIAGLKGIGESVQRKVVEMLDTGSLQALSDLVAKTPPGVLEMLQIKGLGPKKIHTIWKEMGIESIGELLYACNENRLTLYKGFGEKTQRNVQEAIEFYQRNQGIFLYAQLESFATELGNQLREAFPGEKFLETGAYRRQLETLEELAWCTTLASAELKTFLTGAGFQVTETRDDLIRFRGTGQPALCFYPVPAAQIYSTLFQTSASEEFLEAWNNLFGRQTRDCPSEEALFEQAGLPYIPPAMREKATVLARARTGQLPRPVQPGDVRGLIHSHSNWSDGVHTIEEMARELQRRNFEYLVISDHSRSAFYANGLSEDRIREQHRYIDELNRQLHPFRIFKSIECDILNDGSLDYPDPVLAGFDLVIASIHSNLKMTGEKAMARLLKALANPYVTILGHMTGRLLLSRHGYPVDHQRIIEACAAAQVVIELNAHPRRLDIDWRWIEPALEAGVLISIDPDAHAVEGFDDIRYGVLVAQKAGLTPDRNLSSFTLKEMEAFLARRREARGI
ncbi:MAG TPA: helix-hairpin-helix domain-containing protein [Chitinophagaceae bacterium]|nr:helix-hairpin-helix domain-containing protein [Chitinophagaceae bacterium]